MKNDIETDLLLRRIGEKNAREVVRLSYLPPNPPGPVSTGICNDAFEFFTKVATGHTGVYHPGNAREGIEALRRRYADIKPPKA